MVEQADKMIGVFCDSLEE